MNSNTENIQIATLGGGCFWCVEAVYQDLKGVLKVESGYSGGHVENPTYEQICGKQTGHAEVIQITFDAAIISYQELLEIFWVTHNPTTPNQQGNDKGPQYRSVIYYHDKVQKELAEKSMDAASEAKIWDDPIVTEIAPLINYFAAEDYHQNYYKKVGTRNPYCTYVIAPKVEKFKKLFGEKLQKS